MIPESEMTVDDLAQEIRRVDGANSLGAGALAEALMPFLASRLPRQDDEIRKAALEEADLDRSAMEFASTMRSSEDEPGWKWWASYCAGDPEALAMAQAYRGALSQKGDEADGS